MKLSLMDDDDNQVLSTTETLATEDRGNNPKRIPAEERLHETSDELRIQPTDDEQTYNQTDLAKMFGLSRNLVIDILKEHGIEAIPHVSGGPRGSHYKLSDVEDILKHPTAIKSDRKTKATERKLEAEAELKELEVQKRRGEYIAVSDVELGAVQLFRALHNRIVQYADDSALDISRLRTRGEVAALQKERLGKLLQELRTDPNNFISRYVNENK